LRKANPGKNVRLTWSDGTSWIEARFYAKGKDKTQVTVQHGKLISEAAATRMKKFWGEALGRLKEYVES
jgi:hypothetical protein